MKKRTKIMALLMTCVLALSAMCFGFAQWSSELTLNGAVSASGKWDVAVTDASVRLSSTGAALAQTTVTEPVETTYNSYEAGEALFLNQFASQNAMNAKIAERKEAGATILSSNGKAQKYVATISYYDAEQVFHEEEIGAYDTIEACDAARNVRREEILAAGGSVTSAGRKTMWYYTITYTMPEPVTKVSETTFDKAAVHYASVDFSLPGAWAEYCVTITNNGTANADLNHCAFDMTQLNSDIFTVDTPDLRGKVLAPGASCIMTFVVKVDTSCRDLAAEATAFTVQLHYVQETVEDAPAASYR